MQWDMKTHIRMTSPIREVVYQEEDFRVITDSATTYFYPQYKSLSKLNAEQFTYHYMYFERGIYKGEKISEPSIERAKQWKGYIPEQ